MTDTRALLDRIAMFREKLATMPALQEPVPPRGPRPEQVPQPPIEPAKLTARAQRLLLQARELVQRQQHLTATAQLTSDHDPLTRYHRCTVGLTDTALRMAQQFPNDVEGQLHACDSFEFLVQVIEQRLTSLHEALAVRIGDERRMERLTQLQLSLQQGRTTTLNPFVDLANEILDESRRGARLRWIEPLEAAGTSCDVARFIAAHSLNVAQVIARLLPHDFEWAAKPILPVIVALTMDIGLLGIPAPTLFNTGELTAAERRALEAHPRLSAEIIRKMLPESGPLADIVQAHHERPDGTGYPFGLHGDVVPALARFAHVADVYATLMTAQPRQTALDSRAALTEVLVQAEQGRLDRDFAEYLLNLSFHPVGTVVELVDGRVAMVAANHGRRADLRATGRPVVAVVGEADGRVRQRPELIDLAASERGGILRGVPRSEVRAKLGEWYPDLCV